MPLKSNSGKTHHVAHKKEKRTRHFMKVYAPYIPLLLIVGCGVFISGNSELSRPGKSEVKSYATNTTDVGLLDETNKQRAANGLNSLVFNTALDSAAQAKAADMSARDYWAHQTPDGSEPWTFIEAARYSYRKAAENLAYGFSTSQSTVNGWMNSPGHRANVLDPELREVGFGIVNVQNYQGKGPETVVVAMYGQPSVLTDVATTPAPVNTASAEQQGISYIQSVTGGKAPWSGFIIGLLIGFIAMYLVVKHSHEVRKALRTSQNFVIHHPLFDVTLIALGVLAAIASQNIGTIY